MEIKILGPGCPRCSEVGKRTVNVLAELGIGTVWMPPGAWSEAAVAKCDGFGLAHVDDACVILAVKHCGPIAGRPAT
jgi:predicted CoA-binding protein